MKTTIYLSALALVAGGAALAFGAGYGMLALGAVLLFDLYHEERDR